MSFAARLLCALALSVCLTATRAHAAPSATGLVVDRDGQGVSSARVEFLDAQNKSVGKAETDTLGAFHAKLKEVPQQWTVTADGYVAQHLSYSTSGRLLAVLYPNEPGAEKVLSGADFAVLPYQDAGYAFSLVPFAVIEDTLSVKVSDRGLGGGANPEQDKGKSFDTIPAHYLAYAGLSNAFHSYRYRDGTSGHYTLGFDLPQGSGGEFGAGSLQITGLQQRAGNVNLTFGTSRTPTDQRTRWNAVSRTRLGTGRLLVTAGDGFLDNRSQTPFRNVEEQDAALRFDQPIGTTQLTAELTSKRKLENKAGDYSQAGSELEAQLRVAHRSPVLDMEYGIAVARETGSRVYTNKSFEGSMVENRAYVQSTYHARRLQLLVAASEYNTRYNGSTHKRPGGVTEGARGVTAEVSANVAIGDRLSLWLTQGTADNADAVQEIFFGDPVPVQVLDHSDRSIATLEYRGTAFTASATAYRERYLSFLPTTRLSGIGAALELPLSPQLRVKAWTLSLQQHADEVPDALLLASRGRDVAWLTYDNRSAVRFDLIYRRETDAAQAGRYLDADAAFRLSEHLGLVATFARQAGTSTAGIALRFGDFSASEPLPKTQKAKHR